jgi:hypothetical protein
MRELMGRLMGDLVLVAANLGLWGLRPINGRWIT